MTEEARKAIEAARKHLEMDPHLAAYILRDLPEIKAAGLDDLAWTMVGGDPHKNDVLYLIELLEAAIEGGDDGEVGEMAGGTDGRV